MKQNRKSQQRIDINKNQMEILELKNKIAKINSSLGGCNSRMDMTEGSMNLKMNQWNLFNLSHGTLIGGKWTKPLGPVGKDHKG